MNHWQTRVLLVAEDNEHDYAALRRCFQAPRVKLERVRSGDQLVEYLSGTDKYADRERFPLPEALLLDLKLPGKSGLEILQWIRQHPALAALIVIVLSSSADPENVRLAYEARANSYLLKPASQEYLPLARAIEEYWLGVNRGPSLAVSSTERRASKTLLSTQWGFPNRWPDPE